MSVQIGVRFRPLGAMMTPLPPGADAQALARQRWEATFQGMQGLDSWLFERSTNDPPVERPAVLAYAGNVPPMDITMFWDSMEAANAIFGNKDLLLSLWGTVAGTPALHVAGTPQMNAQTA